MYPNHFADKGTQPTSGCAAQTSITVIILTLNEAPNLPQALASVKGWAQEIFVLDSFSTDNVVEIASQAGWSIGDVYAWLLDHEKPLPKSVILG